MMAKLLLMIAMGLATYVGFVAGRYTKECQPQAVGHYYKLLPPTAEPAVNTVTCTSESLHGALETLRVCRARARSELTK